MTEAKKEEWICKNGLKHKITKKSLEDGKFKKCPCCGGLPSKVDIEKATKQKVVRHLK